MSDDAMPPPAKKPRPAMMRKRSSVLAAERAGITAHVDAAPPPPAEDDANAAAKAMFTAHDADANGVLDHAEFRALLLSLGRECNRLHPRYVEHFLRVTDRDKDGQISLDEFLLVHQKLLAFDRLLLNAPKRALAQSGAPPESTSRLKLVASLVCPEVPTVSLPCDPPKKEDGSDDDDDEDDDEAPQVPPFTVDAHFTQLKRLGEGGYGLICSAIDSRSGSSVAIKRVRPTGDHLQLRCCLRELAVLSHFGIHKHDNILGLNEVLRPHGGTHLSNWRDLYMVTDLLEMDLQHVLRSDQPLKESHLQFFTWQLLRGVHALHTAGIIHRDIKPSNLLVNQDCELKIADFGISRGGDPSFGVALQAGGSGDGGGSSSNTLCANDGAILPLLTSTPQVVTLWYRPPELLCGNMTYGSEIDMWSVGVTVAEMLGRSPPFVGENHMKMLRAVIGQIGSPSEEEIKCIEDPRAVAFLHKIGEAEAKEWSDMYSDATTESLSLIESLLQFEPSKRPHAAAALRHPWLSKLHDERDLEEKIPQCPFPFDSCAELSLDHFLLAGLDAVRTSHPEYPLKVAPMQRFGIMHGKSISKVAEGGEEATALAALTWDEE